MSAVFVLFIFLGSFVAHAETTPPTPKPSVKSTARYTVQDNIYSCHGRALEQRDCLLKIGKVKIQVWHDKIIYTDPVTSATESVPDQNEDVIWHGLNALHLGSRWFLNLDFWSGPEKVTGIESLHWFVFEVAGGHVTLKLQRVIQKRVKNAKGEWRSDQAIAHDLAVKRGQIFAIIGRENVKL